MSGPVSERAKRIDRIRSARRLWRWDVFWRNHLTASHEFQLLDVLRDIRLVLTLIFLALVIGYCNQKPGITVVMSDKAGATP